jgi:hypothetical protein
VCETLPCDQWRKDSPSALERETLDKVTPGQCERWIGPKVSSRGTQTGAKEIHIPEWSPSLKTQVARQLLQGTRRPFCSPQSNEILLP